MIGFGFIVLFSLVNLFLWGDGGYDVHLLSIPVDAYILVWVWIGLIASIFITGKTHPMGLVISAWWTANISMTTLLNAFNFRGIEQAGELILDMPGLVLDFVAQGAVDLASLLFIYALVKKGILNASVWLTIFSAYLVANLFGHTFGAYSLMVGNNPDIIAKSYDAYMYLTFTAMLILQSIGSSSDRLLKWSGKSVDLYRDIRPVIKQFVSRHLHLH